MSFQLIDIDYISPSQANTLIGCERKWWHKYVGGMKEPSTEPLAMGGGFATALEEGSLKAGLTEYMDRRPPCDEWMDPTVYERQEWIGRCTITHAVAGYTLRWPDTDVQREVTYLVNLPYTDRKLQVRVDGVAPQHLIEDKLRSGSAMRGDLIENEVRQGLQLTAEVYVRWRQTGDIVPVHLRCMKKCDPRKLKDCQSYEEVNEVVAAHFEKESSFQEFIATRSRDQLEEFERDIAGLCQRIEALDFEDTPRGSKNTSNCMAYGRACPALNLCQGMETEREGVNGTT